MQNHKLVDTNKMFDTVFNEPLDALLLWATGKPPSSGLMLYKCADGRWFLEAEFGNLFDDVDGISKPHLAPYETPVFFPGEKEAHQYAFVCIREKYPELEDRDLSLFYQH